MDEKLICHNRVIRFVKFVNYASGPVSEAHPMTQRQLGKDAMQPRAFGQYQVNLFDM